MNTPTPTQKPRTASSQVLVDAVHELVKDAPGIKKLPDTLMSAPSAKPAAAESNVFEQALPHFLKGFRILTGAEEMEQRLAVLYQEREQATQTLQSIKRMNDSLSESHRLVNKKIGSLENELERMNTSLSKQLAAQNKRIEELNQKLASQPAPPPQKDWVTKEELSALISEEVHKIFNHEETQPAQESAALVDAPKVVREKPEPKKVASKNFSFTVMGQADNLYQLHDLEKAVEDSGDAVDRSYSVLVLGLQTVQVDSVRKALRNLPVTIEALEKTVEIEAKTAKKFDMIAVSRFVTHAAFSIANSANSNAHFITGGASAIAAHIADCFARDRLPEFLNKN